MTLRAETIDALSRQLAEANQRRHRVGDADLSALDRIVQYTPEDMTVTVQAGCRLAVLQASLAAQRQWLPVDPAHPERITIADLIQQNLNGPRRFGYGTVRDHLIGLRAALPDGRVIRSGGQVVKNVAGYDLVKMFIGSRGTLGVVVEATFKLLPLPETESIRACDCDDPLVAAAVVRSVLATHLAPVVLDLCSTKGRACRLVVALAGSRSQVAWQEQQCDTLGLAAPADLGHDTRFWEDASPLPVRRWSMPPDRLADAIATLEGREWIARAGNGLLLYRGDPAPPGATLPRELMRRLKDTFDPNGILPPLPW